MRAGERGVARDRGIGRHRQEDSGSAAQRRAGERRARYYHRGGTDYHCRVASVGGRDETRRLLSLWRRALLRRIAHAVSVHALLLLDLPQDGGRRRLRDQHHGRRGDAAHPRHAQHRRLPGAAPAPRAPSGGVRSPARRHFCAKCGSALWVADPRWPEWVYPFASAIDTPLPKPPEEVELMLDYAAPWAEIPAGAGAPALWRISRRIDRRLAHEARARRSLDAAGAIRS